MDYKAIEANPLYIAPTIYFQGLVTKIQGEICPMYFFTNSFYTSFLTGPCKCRNGEGRNNPFILKNPCQKQWHVLETLGKNILGLKSLQYYITINPITPRIPSQTESMARNSQFWMTEIKQPTQSHVMSCQGCNKHQNFHNNILSNARLGHSPFCAKQAGTAPSKWANSTTLTTHTWIGGTNFHWTYVSLPIPSSI